MQNEIIYNKEFLSVLLDSKCALISLYIFANDVPLTAHDRLCQSMNIIQISHVFLIYCSEKKHAK